MKSAHKTIALWLVILLVFAGIFKFIDSGNRHRTDLKFSQFIQYVKEGKVEEVTFKTDNVIVGTFKAGSGPNGPRYFETVGDTGNAKVFELLEQNNIIPNYERAEKTPIWQQVLISWFPMLLIDNGVNLLQAFDRSPIRSGLYSRRVVIGQSG